MLASLPGAFLLAACGQTPNSSPITRAAQLTATCSGCHSPASISIADLSGYTEAALVQSLTTYRDDGSGTTVMHRIARAYSDEDIAAISSYLAAANE